MKGIINTFRRLKLTNAFLTIGEDVPHRHNSITEPLDEMIKNHVKQSIVIKMADFIRKNHPSAIVEENKGDYTAFRLELFVFGEKDFTAIVEAAIQAMPYDKIQAIKNGEHVLKPE